MCEAQSPLTGDRGARPLEISRTTIRFKRSAVRIFAVHEWNVALYFFFLENKFMEVHGKSQKLRIYFGLGQHGNGKNPALRCENNRNARTKLGKVAECLLTGYCRGGKRVPRIHSTD